MAAPILTQAETIMCPHAGTVTVIPTRLTVQIAGSPVLVMTDPGTIAGCTFQISGAPAPCVSVLWTMPAVSVTAQNAPVLLSSSICMCIGGSGSVPATIIPGTMRVMGT